MTYANFTPTAPSTDIRYMEDAERKIQGKVWNLDAIQAALAAGQLEIIVAPSANEGIELLNWGSNHLRAFVQALSKARYYDSEWCRFNPKSNVYACDTYVMGYSKSLTSENPKARPWVYFKFTIFHKGLLVIRAHEETRG
ncbi:hypothetical protein [Variovorax sp.]|uniref:hypothetical protein n=1 Tax=Variovorax sp. TaxID=1871043 RepID=UPI003BA96021